MLHLLLKTLVLTLAPNAPRPTLTSAIEMPRASSSTSTRPTAAFGSSHPSVLKRNQACHQCRRRKLKWCVLVKLACDTESEDLSKRRETPVLNMRAFSCPCIVSCAIGYKSSVRARVYIRRCRRHNGSSD
ncbi:hypothetical protein K443DRAFT_231576 [Laccaria amethystina LaAM-08-1]|uniref:Zn(2)-C6 fungal-type domain-containing protein n=1 Tax=Laccaria amethystina LaAM-08-1 TaxID=1095629 RepID=A0A0C9XYZ2_9AGAR|nr:hypothetical protein K443DRAFT_231576 [Laccaria amethystina LaAM-08-1]